MPALRRTCTYSKLMVSTAQTNPLLSKGATIRLRTSESSYSKSGKSSFRLMSSIVDSHMVAVNEEEKWDTDRVLSTLHNDALSNTVDAFERAHFTSLSDLMSTYKQCLDGSLLTTLSFVIGV